jgi:hypothetical protein
MIQEEKRLVIAEALSVVESNAGLVFSADHSIPEAARAWMVYDGVALIGYGTSGFSWVPDLVARARMPIVFYKPAEGGKTYEQ